VVEQSHFEFPEFPAEAPKLDTILDAEVPDKHTLTDHLWNLSPGLRGKSAFNQASSGIPSSLK
jgi:hypothetical protein